MLRVHCHGLFSKNLILRNMESLFQENILVDDFSQFESILIDHALKIFRSADDYFNVAKSIFHGAMEQNVRYLETSFHAGMSEFLNLPGQEILNAILSAVPEGLEVRVFLGMSRNAYTDFLGPKLEYAIESWDGLSGIDLHGPEDLPMEQWTSPLWEKAAKRGLTLKAHAGEFGPPSILKCCFRAKGETHSARRKCM